MQLQGLAVAACQHYNGRDSRFAKLGNLSLDDGGTVQRVHGQEQRDALVIPILLSVVAGGYDQCSCFQMISFIFP